MGAASATQLLEGLLAYRPELRAVQHTDVRAARNAGDLRGLIAEHFVQKWLERCPSICWERPPAHARYRCSDGAHRVTVVDRDSGLMLHEYDFLVRYEGRPLAIEVKSGKMHGFFSKIPRAFALASEIYGEEPLLALVIPTRTRHPPLVEIACPATRVHVLESGYTTHNLSEKVRRLSERYDLFRECANQECRTASGSSPE